MIIQISRGQIDSRAVLRGSKRNAREKRLDVQIPGTLFAHVRAHGRHPATQMRSTNNRRGTQ
jgi:hypothetical protein